MVDGFNGLAYISRSLEDVNDNPYERILDPTDGRPTAGEERKLDPGRFFLVNPLSLSSEQGRASGEQNPFQ